MHVKAAHHHYKPIRSTVRFLKAVPYSAESLR